jgi:hypothetical protein
MTEHADGLEWAQEEFGDATLGDERRTKRLVAVAAGALAHPHGRITATFEHGAEREAAFRWIENPACDARQITRASSRATARRAAEYSFVFVPIDGTSLNIADHARSKGTGVVGARFVGARGLQVMTAIAVAPTGTPLGIAHQVYWARRGRKRPGGKQGGRADRRHFSSKESRHWVDTTKRVAHEFEQHAPATMPWFQLDRGGDIRQVLQQAHEQGLMLTVRASADRRLWSEADEPRRYLRECMLSQPVQGCQVIRVPGSAKRQARIATLMVRFARVELDLHNDRGKQRRRVGVGAVLVREVDTTPAGEAPIEWLLLTTHPVASLADAELVVHGYATRWAIEEFHKTWKTDACNVEAMQLHSSERMVRWAAILAAVAMRIQRLMKLARNEPDLPATVELTRGEIRAIIVATKHRKMTAKPDDILTIAEAVKWLGSLGGHSPSPSAGPPGPRTLARGLESIALLARYFDDGAEK